MNINPGETTFIKLLQANSEKFGATKAALREKKRGIWQKVSWKDYYEHTRLFSLGLTSLGINNGDTVAVIGNNRPASLYAVIGAQAAGGVALCLYPESTSAELSKLLKRFDTRFVVAEDQEQVDKILEIQATIPELQAIICCDMRGMRNYTCEVLRSLEYINSIGHSWDEQHKGDFELRIAKGSGDDIALISLTSGATGEPKGAMLSFRNMLTMSESLNQVDKKFDSDEFVSFLPLAWAGEQMTSLASALSIGFAVNFPEKAETAMADLREIGPHIMFSPPRIWQGLASSVQVRIMDTTPFKRFMYKTFMPVGDKMADLQLSGKPVPFFQKIMHGIAYICLFRALRDRLGLSRVRSALTGGSPLGTDVFRFFHAIGINLKQVYGLTEVAGIACSHRDGDIQGTTVGLPLSGTEVRISDEGEILLKSSGIFKGYYNDQESTMETVQDGWLRSGDAGRIAENGHLTVMDRLRDIITLADGTKIAPQSVESKLTFSPYIKEAVVIGAGRPFLTALVCIDGRILGKWAGDNKITYMTYSDLTSKQEIAAFIEKEMAKANRELPEKTRIKRFALLYKDLDADEDELTRTGKVRRAVINERYKEIIEGLYSGADSMPIDVTIDLQDGKSARIKTTVHLRNLE